ncbi:MAG: recombinase family protein [Rhodoplanes sp.]
MRAVIYARYSTENQREASIDDQLEVCRRLITREGWTLLRAYTDAAISGASRVRPGLQQLRCDAERGAFDVIVCEALDRIGRKLADVAELHDLLSYLGIKLVTLATGEVTSLHIGMLGTLAQLTLADLREKTRRGQLGRALQGKIPGGRSYGYDVVEPRSKDGRGERAINPAEADVVRRIFAAFANGESPRAIAKRLNAEGVAGPDGRAWRDTTIRGQVDRGTGLLNNALYAGRLEWNRCSYVKDPRTGKRVARVNAKEQWEIVEVPELRIIGDDLWQRVKERQQTVRIEIGRDEDGNALNRAHRRRFLFSGLLVCGLCGGGYTITAHDRYGCASHKSKGTCGNNRTVLRPEIEERVLAGTKGTAAGAGLVPRIRLRSATRAGGADPRRRPRARAPGARSGRGGPQD